ncbi:MAG: helix-turn-helix domain-containing protein [Cohaesibacteraceae bacterium]|nr:helix-turn-helix domain-containing protein [Cohaesibacteraceae bacterium]
MKHADADDTLRDSPSGALARGLAVLAVMNDLETVTVSRIVAESMLPKATVVRLLQALQAEGYVARDAQTMTYRVTPKVLSLSRAMKGNNEIEGLIQVALDLLAEEIKWPAEYLVIDGLSMLIQSNNRERAPIKLKLFERRRFPLLGSAAGIAFLSSIPDGERMAILRRVVSSDEECVRSKSTITAAATKGYAARLLTELGPNMAVASVPVPDGGGALSLVHFNDVVTQEHLETVILPKLRDCALNIASALKGIYPQ